METRPLLRRVGASLVAILFAGLAGCEQASQSPAFPTPAGGAAPAPASAPEASNPNAQKTPLSAPVSNPSQDSMRGGGTTPK